MPEPHLTKPQRKAIRCFIDAVDQSRAVMVENKIPTLLLERAMMRLTLAFHGEL